MEANANPKSLTEAQRAVASQVVNLYGDGTKDNLRAIAQKIVLPMIEADVIAEDITELILEKVPDQTGEIEWAKKPEHTTYFIDENGDIRASHDQKNTVKPSARVLTCKPVIKLLDLKRGYVASIEEQQEAAKDAIVKAKNSEVLTMMIAAADASMKVTVATNLTEPKLNEAFSKMEDRGVMPKLIVMRGSRGNDIRSFTLPDPVDAELTLKGIQAVQFGGAKPLYTTDMGTGYVIIIGDKKPGRILNEFPLTLEDVETKNMKVHMPMWMTYRAAVTNALRFALITIT